MSEEVKKEQPKEEDKVVSAMHIVYNKETDEYGVIGELGFLDNKIRAYTALVCAEKCLDDFYRQRESMKARIMQGVNRFSERMNFKNFIKNRIK